MRAFYFGNRTYNYGFGQRPALWVLGPLGQVGSRCEPTTQSSPCKSSGFGPRAVFPLTTIAIILCSVLMVGFYHETPKRNHKAPTKEMVLVVTG